MNSIFRYLLLLVCWMLLNAACAQIYTPGQTYFGTDSYIEYQPGTLPLIISVPHGGYLEPADIPDRNCDGCSYVQDAFTQELARQMREAFYNQTGCYPHVVYNLLHRKKLDMNRNLVFATDSNSALNVYWNEYHDFIDAARDTVLNAWGKALFIDLHGHGHDLQRIELGYLLYDTELQESDSVLNTAGLIAVSSIRHLVNDNLGNRTHAALIRGDAAMGTMFANAGYPGVPSLQDPFPLPGEDYFNGGYNTWLHGSSSGGTMDAIQLELNSDIRFDASARANFADSFVVVVRAFLETHYFTDFSNYTCNSVDVPFVHSDENWVLFPNPSQGIVHWKRPTSVSGDVSIFVYNAQGMRVFETVSSSWQGTIHLPPTLSEGVYKIVFRSEAGYGNIGNLMLFREK